MENRNAINPREVKTYTTEQIRNDFLIQNLFIPGQMKLVYSHDDRIIVGGVCPAGTLVLEAGKELRAAYFLERREMGIINIGPQGTVTVDGTAYLLNTRDGLYIGKGAKDITFASADPHNPARFYFNSTPAHQTYPTEKIEIDKVYKAHLGSPAESNERTIHRYIHPQGVKSCQLVMGMTILDPNNMWNTMPCHTHDRRMEVYLYFNLPKDGVVFHLMGEPDETRHIVVRNEEAVISPSWSIHSGVGTSNYTFIWGMAGENKQYTDMDPAPVNTLL